MIKAHLLPSSPDYPPGWAGGPNELGLLEDLLYGSPITDKGFTETDLTLSAIQDLAFSGTVTQGLPSHDPCMIEDAHLLPSVAGPGD